MELLRVGPELFDLVLLNSAVEDAELLGHTRAAENPHFQQTRDEPVSSNSRQTVLDTQQLVSPAKRKRPEPTRIDPNYNFSTNYGHPWDRQAEELVIPPDTEGKTLEALLQCLHKTELGESFVLSDAEYTIGRDLSNVLILSDISVSRYHCRIIRRQDEFWLEDLGSSNGTFVNEGFVSSSIRLANGDVVQFGRRRFRFLLSYR